MNNRHAILLYHYVCPTCGLEIGPYISWHKNIECENCETLLRPVLQKDRVTYEDEDEPLPKVVRVGIVKP